MPNVKANGIAIEYDTFGSPEAEPMLLISGLGAQMTRWTAPFCELLAARGYWVIRFDNRDAGLSTCFRDEPVPDLAALAAAAAQGQELNVPYTLSAMAADAAGLLDALGIRQAHIVGRSMGGMIAQLFAVEYPERTLSLTSFMSSSGNPNLPPADAEVMQMLLARPPRPQEDEAGYVAHGLNFARLISSPRFPFDEAAERDKILDDLRRAQTPGGFGRQLAAIVVDGDRRSRLKTIKVPTLIIHGAEDKLLPLAGGRDTAENIEGAELRVIEGMGHDLPPQLYEELAEAIANNARRAH